MTDKTQPEALRLADWLDDQYDPDHHKADAAAELRRQHARIAELEAELEAVGGVQALSAAPAGWESVIDESRSSLQDSEPSAFDNSGYRAFAETVLDAVEEGLSALAASPTPPAEQAAPKAAPGEPVAWRISDPNEPDLGFWLADEDGGEGFLSEPLYTRTAPQAAGQDARPCHVFTVRKAGGLTEWEPTTMALALPDGAHALYTLPQPSPHAQADSVTAPAVASEPIAYLYDDGSWTPAKTEEGHKLNDWMISAGSPKIGVHLASTAQPTPLTTLAQATQVGNQQEAQEPVAHDEDLLERLYWEFDAQRKKTGEERLTFKRKMRFYASEFRRLSMGKIAFTYSVSDEMMNLADRLGSESDDVDPRAWKHLLVYAPQPAPVVGRMSPSKEWLETRLAIADDSDVQAGVPSRNARPCDAPPGCDSHNCHGCDDFKHPSPTPQPAPAPLSDDTKRLAWMADEWTPGHEKLYDKHVLETGGVGGLDDLRTFIDKQIAAQEGKT